MRHYRITLFEFGVQNILNLKSIFEKNFLIEIKSIGGEVHNIQIHDNEKKIEKKLEMNKYKFEKVSSKFSYLFNQEGKNFTDLFYNEEKRQLTIQMEINNYNNPISELEKFAYFIGNNFNVSSFSVRNVVTDNHLNTILNKKDKDEYDPLNYYYVADTSWINIYPSEDKRLKDKIDLPINDEFYLNIPAYNVEKLKNGSILVVLNKDPENVEETLKANIKVIDYYKQQLTKMGIWKKVKWWTDWKEKYRDVLKEHGFEI